MRQPAQREGEIGFAQLEARLGYRFRDAALLRLALTHKSHVYEGNPEAEASEKNQPGTDNEQLEFLGDAVLGLVVSELLVERFPGCDEGELTRIRASLVSRKRMAELGAELGLGEYLLLGRSAERSGGRTRPALLANAVEAVMAAMLLDARRHGEDGLLALRTLAAERLVDPEAATIREALKEAGGRGALRDPKTILQERVQAEGAGRLRYVDTEQTGPAHARRIAVEARLQSESTAESSGETARVVRVLAAAEGASKREAQQRAAELALAAWPVALEDAPESA
jgi:ribonuclease-3